MHSLNSANVEPLRQHNNVTFCMMSASLWATPCTYLCRYLCRYLRLLIVSLPILAWIRVSCGDAQARCGDSLRGYSKYLKPQHTQATSTSTSASASASGGLQARAFNSTDSGLNGPSQSSDDVIALLRRQSITLVYFVPHDMSNHDVFKLAIDEFVKLAILLQGGPSASHSTPVTPVTTQITKTAICASAASSPTLKTGLDYIKTRLLAANIPNNVFLHSYGSCLSFVKAQPEAPQSHVVFLHKAFFCAHSIVDLIVATIRSNSTVGCAPSFVTKQNDNRLQFHGYFGNRFANSSRMTELPLLSLSNGHEIISPLWTKPFYVSSCNGPCMVVQNKVITVIKDLSKLEPSFLSVTVLDILAKEIQAKFRPEDTTFIMAADSRVSTTPSGFIALRAAESSHRNAHYSSQQSNDVSELMKHSRNDSDGFQHTTVEELETCPCHQNFSHYPNSKLSFRHVKAGSHSANVSLISVCVSYDSQRTMGIFKNDSSTLRMLGSSSKHTFAHQFFGVNIHFKYHFRRHQQQEFSSVYNCHVQINLAGNQPSSNNNIPIPTDIARNSDLRQGYNFNGSAKEATTDSQFARYNAPNCQSSVDTNFRRQKLDCPGVCRATPPSSHSNEEEGPVHNIPLVTMYQSYLTPSAFALVEDESLVITCSLSVKDVRDEMRINNIPMDSSVVSDQHDHREFAYYLLGLVALARLAECGENEVLISTVATNFTSGSSNINNAVVVTPRRIVKYLLIWVGSTSRLEMMNAQEKVLMNESFVGPEAVVSWKATEDLYPCRAEALRCDTAVADQIGSLYSSQGFPGTKLTAVSTSGGVSPGWACAQRRQLRALSHTLRLFDPKYVIVLDDDTYLNWKAVKSRLDNLVKNAKGPKMHHGEPIIFGDFAPAISIYYGGAGYILTESAVRVLLQRKARFSGPSVLREIYEKESASCVSRCMGNAFQHPESRSTEIDIPIKLIDLCSNYLSRENTCYHSDHAMSKCLFYGSERLVLKALPCITRLSEPAAANKGDRKKKQPQLVERLIYNDNGMCQEPAECDTSKLLTCHRFVAYDYCGEIKPVSVALV